MDCLLDSLHILTQPRATIMSAGTTLLVVNTYTVRDSRCNIRKRRFVILSDGHYLVRALLNVSINGNGSVLQFGDIITINHYNMIVAKDTCVLMIHDFYIKHSNINQPNGFPEWFSIDIGNVKDSKSVHSEDKVWFTLTNNNQTDSLAEKDNGNSIIDNWVILPNGSIAGTVYQTIKEFNEAPLIHSKTDTHGVASYKYLPSIATNIALPFCCLTTLELNPNSDFDSVKPFSNITTLSGSTYYLAYKQDNTDINEIVQSYNKNTSTLTLNTQVLNSPRIMNIHTINSSIGFGRDMFLGMPQAQVERMFTASFMENMVHNNQYVCKVKLCLLPGHIIPTDVDVVYFYLSLYEYTRSRDLYVYLQKDKSICTNGPPIVGDHVSVLMRGELELSTSDTFKKDLYMVSFVSHSRLLQCQYSESDVSTMRSLYIDLNEMVSQDDCTYIEGQQESNHNPLSKYGKTQSNIPIIRPIVSTTSDPLSEDDFDDTGSDDEENSCPLHRGGYKRINYNSDDQPITKKYRLSPLY